MEDARTSLAREIEEISPKTLKSARMRKGWTQQQLALVLNTTQAQVSRIENGSGQMMFPTACRLADVLGLTLEQIRQMTDAAVPLAL